MDKFRQALRRTEQGICSFLSTIAESIIYRRIRAQSNKKDGHLPVLKLPSSPHIFNGVGLSSPPN
jgi:hypothetical protein